MSTVSNYFCIFCDFTCSQYDRAFNHYKLHLFAKHNCEICDYNRLAVFKADPRDLSVECNHQPYREWNDNVRVISVDYSLSNEQKLTIDVTHYWINKFLSYQKKILDTSYEKLLVANKVCAECAVCRYLVAKYYSRIGDMSGIQYIDDNKVEHCYQHMRYDTNTASIMALVGRHENRLRLKTILKLEAFIEHCCDTFFTASKMFYIQNIDSGLVVEIQDSNREPNAAIIMSAHRGRRSQVWHLKDGMIHSALNSLVLDINQIDGRRVNTNPANGNSSQKWHFDSDNTIRCEYRNLVFGVENDERTSGAKVRAYHKQNQANQLFRIVYI